MFLRKKAQSIAEYAIVLGLVVAVAAGVLSGILKGGIRSKQNQAMQNLLTAGNTYLEPAEEGLITYEQEFGKSTITQLQSDTVLQKGGAEGRLTVQSSTTDKAVSIETINASDTTIE